jgi:hypothetical protein
MKLVMNICVEVFFGHKFSFLLDIYLGMKLLGDNGNFV